jgi:hypothetical protein
MCRHVFGLCQIKIKYIGRAKLLTLADVERTSHCPNAVRPNRLHIGFNSLEVGEMSSNIVKQCVTAVEGCEVNQAYHPFGRYQSRLGYE